MIRRKEGRKEEQEREKGVGEYKKLNLFTL